MPARDTYALNAVEPFRSHPCCCQCGDSLEIASAVICGSFASSPLVGSLDLMCAVRSGSALQADQQRRQIPSHRPRRFPALGAMPACSLRKSRYLNDCCLLFCSFGLVEELSGAVVAAAQVCLPVGLLELRCAAFGLALCGPNRSLMCGWTARAQCRRRKPRLPARAFERCHSNLSLIVPCLTVPQGRSRPGQHPARQVGAPLPAFCLSHANSRVV